MNDIIVFASVVMLLAAAMLIFLILHIRKQDLLIERQHLLIETLRKCNHFNTLAVAEMMKALSILDGVENYELAARCRDLLKNLRDEQI